MTKENTANANVLSALIAVSEAARFNQWAGFIVVSAKSGDIDRACGFAASTVSGPVLASQFSVRCMAPAKEQRFIVRERVVRAGRRQVFAAAELYGESLESTLCASGDSILIPLGESR